MKHDGRVKVTPGHACADTEVSPVTWRGWVRCAMQWLFNPPPPHKRLGTHYKGGWVGFGACLDGTENLLLGFDPQKIQSVAVHRTDYCSVPTMMNVEILWNWLYCILLCMPICVIYYTGRFTVYSRITKICERKTVGHVFSKPVQIEGITQKKIFSRKLFFIVVHISATRRCEGIRISVYPCWHKLDASVNGTRKQTKQKTQIN
jgi:hypothetical protein